MPFNLEITFGGLCLFVQRDDSVHGLFVLMPEYMQHQPMMIYDGTYTGETQGDVVHIRGQSIPIIGHYNGPRTTIDPVIAPVSEIAEGRRVADHWTEDAVPAAPLSARIVMDLGLTVVPQVLANPPKVKATYKKNGEMVATSHVHIATGFATVSIPVNAATISIAGKTFSPQSDAVELLFVNIPPGDLSQTQPKPHRTDELVEHFSAYYTLMKGCPPKCSGPEVRVAEDFYPPKGPFRNGFVDPVTCMLGNGCSEGEAC
jgi:hypothetical protein